MLHIGLQFENTAEELAAAVSLLGILQSLHNDEESARPEDLCGDKASSPTIAVWFAHLGAGSRSFWELAARFAQNHSTFTFDDLAAEANTEKETLRSYHRNSYRAIRDE